MLTLTQGISRVCARLNKNSADTSVANRIKNHFNDAMQEKWHGFAWSFRWREYPLVTTAMVSSGTLTATNGSQSVTASGTPFDLILHKGAWLRFLQDSTSAWYRVVNVPTTGTLTIEPPYQGTSGSSKTYNLCKTDYLLPTEISDVARLKVTVDNRPLFPTHNLQSDGYFQPPLNVGYPYNWSLYNQDQVLTTYSTGTVSGTINTLTLTGSGTAWLANVQPGDEILISGDTTVYKVQLVNSDTTITLYNNLVIAPITASYTISRQYGKVLRVQPCPDQAYVCFVKGLRAYSPLVNNTDTNELMVRYPAAVLESVIWREASSSPDPREDSLYMKSEKLWATAQGEDEGLIAPGNPTPIWDPRLYI